MYNSIFQLRVMVSDGGIPACTRTSVVTIDVMRNLNDPMFTQSEWTATILETHNLQKEILTLQAKDADDRVS